ncbi:hypothetical protein BJ165DRAFT_1468210 [Panaeolus papilionaceus]|nr:hypothetical protein BJ165DRAFT_1468210 [Panaeolus papilionaceus]
MDRKIVDLSDAELASLGFLGDAASPGMIKIVEAIKAHPGQLGYVSCLMLDCLKRQHPPPNPQQDVPKSTQPPPNAPRFPIRVSPTHSSDSDHDVHTLVAPHLISNYERHYYYHGISRNPPKLLYRSDLETNPFPIPQQGTHFSKIPYKTVNGVFNTPLNPIWDTQVFPRVSAAMKTHGIKWSSINTARFTTVTDHNITTGPIVIWIAVRPNTTTSEALRDASPAILNIFTKFEIMDVVLEWYEGEMHHLAGPSLMNVVNRTNPTFGLNHAFNTGLGIPIARESDGAQGTLTFLFKEMKTKEGKVSDRVLGVTNKHVACKVTTEDYEFNGTDPQYILVCGEERLQRAIAQIEKAISTGLRNAVKLVEEVSGLEAKVGTPAEDSRSLRRIRTELKDLEEDNMLLETFLNEINREWQNGESRRLGIVEWAPKISVDVDHCCYTRDLATIVIDPYKLVNFERNVIDLGDKFTTSELEDRFWPHDATRQGNTIPVDHQLPILRALPHSLTIQPDTVDERGEPLYVVGKYGNATNLTLGCYSAMSGYKCNEFEEESREVAVYNYTKNQGHDLETHNDFSDYGDSGSLIFTGSGDGLAMLHSGTPYGTHSHVTFGTPLWWVMEQIRTRYPFAEFYGIN